MAVAIDLDVEDLAHALFADRRAGAEKTALGEDGNSVSRASLIAQARWSDSDEVSTSPDDLDRVALQRLLDACVAQVSHVVSDDCPVPAAEEAVIRLAAWIHESPAASTARPTAAAFRSSGAASAVSSWTRRPAVVVG